MDRSDDPTRRKRKPSGEARESKPVELRTTDKRLDPVRKIYARGEVQSIAHNPKLHEKFERARARSPAKPGDDGYKAYKGIRTDLSKHSDFDSKTGKRIHHVDYPRKDHKEASLDTRNLLLTNEQTHKDLHRATGGKGLDMYRKKEFLNHPDRGVRDTVKDYFNFQNPKSTVPLDKVARKLELKKRLERVPVADKKTAVKKASDKTASISKASDTRAVSRKSTDTSAKPKKRTRG